MGGVISLAVAMVSSIHLYLCTVTHRRSGIPVKVFLVGLRPDSHTDILDLTPLRSLVYFDCEGPRGRIDILDLSLSLSLGLAEFYIGRCRRDTNPSPVRLDIVEMDMVASCRIFMVCCFDRDFITTIWLTMATVPDNVILAVLVRPDRHLDRLNTFWTKDIRDNDVKSTGLLVVVLDG